MTKKARTIGDFRAEHDPDTKIPNQIRAALAEMLKEGPEHWETNQEVATRARTNVNTLAKYRDMFKDHQVEVKNKSRELMIIWFADAKVAAKERKHRGQ